MTDRDDYSPRNPDPGYILIIAIALLAVTIALWVI